MIDELKTEWQDIRDANNLMFLMKFQFHILN